MNKQGVIQSVAYAIRYTRRTRPLRSFEDFWRHTKA